MPLTTAQKLAEAKQYLHEILTGQGVTRHIDQNGESVTYSRGNVQQLRAYIAELEAELAGTTATQYRGPLRFTFGRRQGF